MSEVEEIANGIEYAFRFNKSGRINSRKLPKGKENWNKAYYIFLKKMFYREAILYELENLNGYKNYDVEKMFSNLKKRGVDINIKFNNLNFLKIYLEKRKKKLSIIKKISLMK